ncbi:MAG: hypothetical protein KGR24_10565 [Planctomycetes bacterium]|nr:hypothetical protein [Planctomycetota bacterium]
MKRLAMLVVAVAVVGMGVSFAQQPVQPRPQTTRSYRSYSVSPSTRGNSAQRSRLANDATWRHAEAKPQGQYHSGR